MKQEEKKKKESERKELINKFNFFFRFASFFFFQENIGFFLREAKNLGVDDLYIFVTVDLYEEKNLSKVIKTRKASFFFFSVSFFFLCSFLFCSLFFLSFFLFL